MKNNFLKTFIVLLLTLTVITNVTFGINAKSNVTGISVCTANEGDEPYDSGPPRPWNP